MAEKVRPPDVAAAPARLAVLASGTGSILAALIDARLPIVLVAVDRPCDAEGIALRSDIASERVEREDFSPRFDRPAYTERLVALLRRYEVDTVAMAGFGTVLAPSFFDAYGGRVVNTHPSLLPAHPGWHAVVEALQAGDTVTGCTVHLATATVDDGPILAQAEVPILDGDTPERLHERIKQVERRLYPETLRTFLASAPAPDRRRREGVEA